MLDTVHPIGETETKPTLNATPKPSLVPGRVLDSRADLTDRFLGEGLSSVPLPVGLGAQRPAVSPAALLHDVRERLLGELHEQGPVFVPVLRFRRHLHVHKAQ